MLYTKVLHQARKHLGISTNDYCVADEVNLLSGPTSKVPGWCTKGKEKMAEDMDLSRQAIINCVDRLVSKELVERQEKTGFLRTTALWKSTIEHYESLLKQELVMTADENEIGVKKVDTAPEQGCKESGQGVKILDTDEAKGCTDSLQGVNKVYTFIGHLGVNFLYRGCKDSLQEGCKLSLQQGVKFLDTYIYSIDIKINTERESTRRLQTTVENKDTASVVVEKKEALDRSDFSTESIPDAELKPPTPPVAAAPLSSEKPKPEKPRYGDGVLQQQVNQFYLQNRDDKGNDLYPPEMGVLFLEWFTEIIQTSERNRDSDIGQERWRIQNTWNIRKRLASFYERYLDDQKKIALQQANESRSLQNTRHVSGASTGRSTSSGNGSGRAQANGGRKTKRPAFIPEGLFDRSRQNGRNADASSGLRTIKVDVDPDSQAAGASN